MGEGTYWDGAPYLPLTATKKRPVSVETEMEAKYGPGRGVGPWRMREGVRTEGVAGHDVAPDEGMAQVPSSETVRYTPTGSRVVHLVAAGGPPNRAARCGRTKGLAWPRDPSDVTLLADRFCANCWNRWAKEKAADGGR